MADTRKDRRAPVSLKVRFKSATVDEFVEQYAVDVSRGGIFIKSKSPMSVGTLLKFEFQLKDESRLIHGVGRVVWKREEADADKEKPPGMGIKFIKMDPHSRALVEKISAKRGDAPGQFERGRGRARSVKKTQAFFPAPLPVDQLPAPEDSTQVRHASEFLAEALAAGDQDAAKEAAESAEKARKRTEEIAAERAAAAKAAKQAEKDAAVEAATRAETEKAEAEKADAARAETEKAEAEKADADEASESEDADSGDGDSDEADADKVAAAKDDEEDEADHADEEDGAKDDADKAAEAAEDGKAAEAKQEAAEQGEKTKKADKTKKTKKATTRKEKASSATSAARTRSSRPAPAEAPEEPRSMMVPVLIVVIAVAAVGYFFTIGQEEGEEPPRDVVTATEEPTPDWLMEADAEAVPTDPDPDSADEVDAAALATLDPSNGDDAMDPAATVGERAMVSVRISSSPSGATVEIGGLVAGETPFSTEMPVGETVEVVLRKDEYVTGRETVTPTEEQSALRFSLERMPYVIIADVSPSGARVVSGGREADDSGTIVLPRPPRGPVTVNAYKGGFASGSQQVLRHSFALDGERMVARVSITLDRRSAANRPSMARPSMMVAMRPATEPSVGEEPAEPTMADPAPAPTMADPAPTMADPEPPTTADPEPPTTADPEPPTMATPAEVPDNPF